MLEFELNGGWPDELSAEELKIKERLITDGSNECKQLLGKQKKKEDYFFYEGSIDGFEECKNFLKFSDFEIRIKELHLKKIREVSKSSLEDDLLRENLRIYNKQEKTNDDEVFRIIGLRTQISFIYDRLMGYRLASLTLKSKAKIKNKDNIKYSYSAI